MLKYMRKVFIVAAMAFLAMGAQAQNLVKNGNFDTPLNNEKTYASIPSAEGHSVNVSKNKMAYEVILAYYLHMPLLLAFFSYFLT